MLPVISIMSHKRPEILEKYTLNYLHSVNTSFIIHVFCSQKKDKEDYNNYFKNHPLYAQLTFINAPDKYLDKCNYIYRYFDVDQQVFWFEDDIKELSILENGKLTKLIEFDKFVNDGFNECIVNHSKIFGIYPVYNHYFMKKNISYDFKFLIANAFGFISTKNNKNLYCHSESKCDYERSILYYENYGRIIRFNFIGAKTNNYRNKGGLNDDNRKERESNGAFYLLSMYPQYIAYKEKSNSPYEEIRTKKINQGDYYDQLYALLKGWKIPWNEERPNVSGIKEVYCYSTDVAYNHWRYKGYKCQSITFGKIRPFLSLNGTPMMEKKHNISHKFYYDILKYYMKKIFHNMEYSNITVNRNFLCKIHKDGKNVGVSTIFTIGNFTGGEINVSGMKYDIFKNPKTFNGSEEFHFTEPFEGDRISIILYKRN